MAMHRSAIGIALRRTALAPRFFSSGGSGSPGCSGTTSALRRPALASSFFSNGIRGSPGCSGTTRRRMCSYGRGGSKWNDDSESSNTFCYVELTRMDYLFLGIGFGVAFTFGHKVRTLEDRAWQRRCERLDNTDKRKWMMAMMEERPDNTEKGTWIMVMEEDQKTGEVNISFR